MPRESSTVRNRCPLSVSTIESEWSMPTSMTTKRKSIITAPV